MLCPEFLVQNLSNPCTLRISLAKFRAEQQGGRSESSTSLGSLDVLVKPCYTLYTRPSYSHSCPGSDADQATTLPYEMGTLPYEPAAPEAPLLQPPVDAAGEKPLPKVSWLKINPK